MNISDIKIGDRHRVDMGDLQQLADSIKIEGLLQPIGLTPEHELVFGYRRLVACRDHLGWTEIAIRTVNVTSIIAGEYAENEMRKDFTVSERVAILEAIERKPRGRNYSYSEDLPNREKAVQLAGLGNTTTARDAIMIIHDGIPDLVAAVDRGEIAIEPAAIIAREPKSHQATVIALPVPERRSRVRELGARQRAERAASLCQPKPIKPKREKIVIPYQKMHWPTTEEVGRPHDDPIARDAHIDRYGRTPLHPMTVADLLKSEHASSMYVDCLRSFINQYASGPEAFFEDIARLLAHVPDKEKTNGLERDFAREGRQTLRQLRETLPAAIDRLTALQVALAAYDGENK